MIDTRGLSQAELGAIFEEAELQGLTRRPADSNIQAAARQLEFEVESEGTLPTSGLSPEPTLLADEASKFAGAPEDRARALASMEFEILPYVFEGKFASAARDWHTALQSPDDSIVRAAALNAVRASIDGQKLTELCISASQVFNINKLIGTATSSANVNGSNSPNSRNFDIRSIQKLLKLSKIADLARLAGWGPTDVLSRFSSLRFLLTGYEGPAGLDEGEADPPDSSLADRAEAFKTGHLRQANSPRGLAGLGQSPGPERRPNVQGLEPSRPNFGLHDGTAEEDLASFLLS